ncbi:hypothetical protein MGG_17581 [Pyricularia oryzae 70-15]|uniref:Uncharacterized protein n=1 Tax=Pyricularia oryzae (strain 70-15 / ATCC MYA-4617 / FGSC 8958) TaxID=242507 RepID=G4NFU8_PYRO7|nr:uncharacterized protein MGG_17581 [Pyricularia oryzae 70-15]EHA46905.1 hypothetical protein MGG_17581 [Pyricularia oryzae 70-15]
MATTHRHCWPATETGISMVVENLLYLWGKALTTHVPTYFSRYLKVVATYNCEVSNEMITKAPEDW